MILHRVFSRSNSQTSCRFLYRSLFSDIFDAETSLSSPTSNPSESSHFNKEPPIIKNFTQPVPTAAADDSYVEFPTVEDYYLREIEPSTPRRPEIPKEVLESIMRTMLTVKIADRPCKKGDRIVDPDMIQKHNKVMQEIVKLATGDYQRKHPPPQWLSSTEVKRKLIEVFSRAKTDVDDPAERLRAFLSIRDEVLSLGCTPVTEEGYIMHRPPEINEAVIEYIIRLVKIYKLMADEVKLSRDKLENEDD